MPRIEFSHRHVYSSQAEGISLPIILGHGTMRVDFLATVDTGCSRCLFERQHGEMLKIYVEGGEPKTFWTAAGSVDTFGHTVEIEFAGMTIESMVYFFADHHIRKNLLGRTGWLDRIRFGLVDHDLTLYLAPYDFQSE